MSKPCPKFFSRWLVLYSEKSLIKLGECVRAKRVSDYAEWLDWLVIVSSRGQGEFNATRINSELIPYIRGDYYSIEIGKGLKR